MLREVPSDQLDDALRAVLAPHGSSRAGQSAVAAFKEYLATTRVGWSAWFEPSIGFDSCAFAIRLPGRSAVVMVPSGDGALYRAALMQILAQLRTADPGFIQLLIEPESRDRREAVTAAGFRRLTRLVYLERNPTYPWVEPPASSEVEWIAYSTETHGRFRAAIAQSYVDSLDCPELTHLRNVDDAIASHRVAGVSDTNGWELMRAGSRDIGVVLLARIGGAAALELSYMGVVPDARGRGMGELLLRRALERARTRGARLVTIVVDERNAPARKLYERMGFRAIAAREAYLLARKEDDSPAWEPCG